MKATLIVHKRYPNCLSYYCGKPDEQLRDGAYVDKLTGAVGSFVWAKVTCKKCLRERK